LQQFIVAAQAAFLLQSQCLVCFSLRYGMKKTRKDRTIAEKLELLDRYKTLSHFSQCEAAERLGITRGFLQGLLKTRLPYVLHNLSLAG